MDPFIEKTIKALRENRQLRNWVMSLVAKDGGNKQDAENLFLKTVRIVWEKLERGEDILDLEAFVKVVARNNWNQQHKRNRLRKEKLRKLSLPSITPSVEKEFLNKEIRDLFWKGVQQMGEPCRQILYFFYEEGRSHQEIARELNIGKDAGWVKRKAYTCRMRLKEWLFKLPEFKDIL